MRRYAWPGNLRELRNVIERAVILCSGESIEMDDLSETIQTASELRLGGSLTVQEIEAEHIRRVLTSHTLDEAAGILGIDPATLYRKRKKLGLGCKLHSSQPDFVQNATALGASYALELRKPFP